MERRRVRYGGRVQGVGFRATAQFLARQHPVTGWVRNEEDGGVLMEVQGEPGAIDALLRALRERMAGNILREDAAAGAIDPAEAGFEVRR
jgi:acylphosphatase